MSEAELIAVRRQKLEDLEAAGIDPFPARFPVDASVQAVVARYADVGAEALAERAPSLRLAGRVVGQRLHGKSAFVDLSDGRERLQAYGRLDALGEESFERWKGLDFGDFVGVEGELFRTRTDELTVKVASWSLLAKALRPPPEKWHGLQDVETRYRQRYLDLQVNPEVRAVFEARARIVAGLRAHHDATGFVEVETPMMQPLYGGAAARPFRTHHNALDLPLYLRIAPELYLKRLLVGGFERVYEINRNFRNEGISRQHNPEFTMLEAYAAYWDYERMMDFAEEVLSSLLAAEAGAAASIDYQGREVDLERPWRRLPLRQAVVEIGGAPEGAGDDPEALAAWLGEQGVEVDDPGHARLLEAALEKVVEPHLTAPTFITDFPRDISPLSKSCPDRPEVAERFELFVGGLELANGFSELNDPREQRRRMEEQLAERQRTGTEEVPPEVDEDYITALEQGMPPAAGIGIGVDRLVMLATDSASIRDVILFPLLRPRDAR